MYLFIQILALFFAHDIHITKSQINFSPEDQSFQVSMHVFLDDFEKVIQDETGFSETMHLGTEKEVASGDSLIAAYLQNHFILVANNDTLQLSYLGKENSDDLLAVWCYFEFPVSTENIDDFSLTNNVLMELYDDQQNIISLKGPDKRKNYFLFKKDDATAIVNY